MSNTKFTKGPWIANYGGSIGHVKALRNVSTHNTPTVARCDVLTLTVSDDEKKANAQLIAEAPELYKMVEQLTSELAFAIKEANLWRKRLINLTTENEPELLEGQTCHEAQILLAKIRGES